MWKKAGLSLGMVVVGLAAASAYSKNKRQGKPITGATNPSIPEKDAARYADE